MTLPEKLARYAKLLHRDIECVSLPPGATIAQKGRRLYRPRRLSRPVKDQPPDQEETAGSTSPHLGVARRPSGRCFLEEDELLAELVRPPPTHLCILGEGGLGKSELFQQLACILSERLLSHVSGPALRVPVLVYLKYWEPRDPRADADTSPQEWLSRFIRNAINRLAEPGEELLSEQELIESCHRNDLVVLLDGLDEVRGVSERQELVGDLTSATAPGAFLSGCSVLLSSRPEALHGLDLGARFRVAPHRLEPLENTDALARYVQLYFGEGSQPALRLEAWLTHASPQLQQFLRVPLFLSLLCATHEAGRFPLPGTPADLLETGMRFLYSRRLTRFTEAGLELLGELAELLVEAASIDKREAVKMAMRACKTNELIGATFAERDVESFLDLLAEQSGILRPTRHGYCFTRQVYADYLAGQRLAHRAREQPADFLRNVQERAWRPEWEEPLRWAAAELWRSNRGVARCLVEWVLAHVEKDRDDLGGTLATLACRLLSGISDLSGPAEQPLAERAADSAISAWHSARRYLGDQAVADRSVVLAMLPSSAHRCLTAATLRLLSSYGAHDRIQLTDPMRVSLAGLSMKLGAQLEQVVLAGFGSVKSLVELALGYDEKMLAELASTAEGVISRELVALLREPTALFSWSGAARALRYTGTVSRDAALALISILQESTDEWAPDYALEALGELRSPHAELIACLSSGVDKWASFGRAWQATRILAGLAGTSEEALKALVAIATRSKSFRGRVAAARVILLHRLAADGLDSALMDVLRHSREGSLRIEAVHILCELGVHTAEMGSVLLQMASDEKGLHRGHAIASLGSLRAPSQDVVRFLRGLLADECHACDAARALRELGEVTHDIVTEAVARLSNAILVGGPIPEAWVGVLGKLGIAMPEVVAVLLGLIQGGQAESARSAAILAIIDLIDGVPTSCGEAVASTESRIRKLGPKADDVMEALLAILRDPDAWKCQCEAARALRMLGRSNDACCALVDVIKNPNGPQGWHWSRSILESLSPISDELVAAIARRVHDPRLAGAPLPGIILDALRSTCSRAAAEALMDLGHEEAALGCFSELGLAVLPDKTIRSRTELRLDLGLCPAELMALLGRPARPESETAVLPQETQPPARPALTPVDNAILAWITKTLSVKPEPERASALGEAHDMLLRTVGANLSNSQQKAYRSWWWVKHCWPNPPEKYDDVYDLLCSAKNIPFYDVDELKDKQDVWKKHLSDAKRKLGETRKHRAPGEELRSVVPPIHFGTTSDRDRDS